MAPDSAGLLYRPLHPSDYAALKLLHQRLFPLNYDDDFFFRAVHGLDGIVAWAASVPMPSLTHVSVGPDLAPQLQQLQQQEHMHGSDLPELLAGFITARAFPALFADPCDRQLLGLASPTVDQERLLYVLTLGVAEPHQRHGVGRRLLDLVLNHAADTGCRAVYLHVASFNLPALAFYQRAGFRELAVLPNFYTIRTGRQPVPYRDHYDACLFGCLIKPPQPTPWDTVNLAVVPLMAVIESLNTCLPWGSDRLKQDATVSSSAAAAAAATRNGPIVELLEDASSTWPADLGVQQHLDGQDLRQHQHQHQENSLHLANGSVVSLDTAQRWDALQPQQQPVHTASPPSSPPNWLRNLFTRR